MAFEIVLVDDDSMICMVHKLILQSAGVKNKPVTKPNGLQAITHLDRECRDNEKQFLIFLDINMPKMDGWEFLDELSGREFKERVRVIMVTSSVNVSDREKAEKYPLVIDYVEKPLEVETVEIWMKRPDLLPFFS